MLSDFAKEKVFWTRKMNLKLVKYIHSKPNIWNPKHPKYTSVEYRDRTYAEFAAKYDNEFTGQAVKDRWTNIRSTFAKYVRNVTTSRMKGEEYKVNWHLWEPCQFLLKVNKKIKADTSTYTTNTFQDNDIKDNSRLSTNEEDWNSEGNEVASNSSATNPNGDCTTIAENLLNVFKGVQNDAFGLDNSRNAKIGRAVNRKLSQMNSYDAAATSQKIMEVLLLYDANNPLNPNKLKADYV